MRVCYLIGRFPPVYGGATKVEIIKSISLIKRGHEIYFLTPRFSKDHPKYESYEGINVIRLAPPLKGPISELLFVLNSFLYIVISKIKPDLLVDVIPFGNSMVITRFFSQLLHLPIVARLTQSGSNEPLSALTGKFSFIKKRLFSTYKKIIAISPDLYENSLKAGISDQTIELIANCVDTGLFSPINEEEKKRLKERLFPEIKGDIVSVVGTVTARKRSKLAIEAWNVLKSMYDRPVSLIFVGPVKSSGHPFDDQYVAQLKKKINHYGLDNSTIFTGFKKNVQEYFQVSDISLFLSEREGLPGVVLQSMACGIPIVTTRIENITEYMMTDGHEGIVSSDDPGEIAEHIMILLSEPERRKEMGKNGRENVVRRFSVDEITKKIEKLYYHVIS